jgi:hypothetical protein
VRRILMGAVGTTILAAVVTVGAIATSAPKQPTVKGGWGSRSGSAVASSGTSQAQAAPSNAGDFSTLLHVVLRQETVAFLDSNPAGARGDQLLVEGPVLKPNTNDPDRIGFFTVRCQFVAPAKGLLDCNVTFNLYGDFPHGATITAQGLSSDSSSWINAVTGGTRRYANATGQVHLQNIGTTVDVDAWFYLNNVR